MNKWNEEQTLKNEIVLARQAVDKAADEHQKSVMGLASKRQRVATYTALLDAREAYEAAVAKYENGTAGEPNPSPVPCPVCGGMLCFEEKRVCAPCRLMVEVPDEKLRPIVYYLVASEIGLPEGVYPKRLKLWQHTVLELRKVHTSHEGGQGDFLYAEYVETDPDRRHSPDYCPIEVRLCDH